MPARARCEPRSKLSGRTSSPTPNLGVHFARLAVSPGDEGLDASSAWLAFESNFDTALADDEGARKAHLDALAVRARDALGALFAGCEGLAAGAVSRGSRGVSEGAPPPATASYQGHADRGLSRIRLEQHLREVVLAFFEKADRASPQELFERVRKHVRACSGSDPRLAGLNIDGPAPALPDPAVRSQHLRENCVSPWIKAATLRRRRCPSRPGSPRALFDWQPADVVYDVRGHQEQWTAGRQASLLGHRGHGRPRNAERADARRPGPRRERAGSRC